MMCQASALPRTAEYPKTPQQPAETEPHPAHPVRRELPEASAIVGEWGRRKVGEDLPAAEGIQNGHSSSGDGYVNGADAGAALTREGDRLSGLVEGEEALDRGGMNGLSAPPAASEEAGVQVNVEGMRGQGRGKRGGVSVVHI